MKLAAASKKSLNGKGFPGQHTSRNRTCSVTKPEGRQGMSLPLSVSVCLQTCPLCAHLHRWAHLLALCACGQVWGTQRRHSKGFLRLFAQLPASHIASMSPASWGQLVLLHINRIGPCPCPGPGRDANLLLLPRDSLQADLAPAPPGTEFWLSLNFSICLHHILPCASRPFPPGNTFTELQGLAAVGGFLRASSQPPTSLH